MNNNKKRSGAGALRGLCAGRARRCNTLSLSPALLAKILSGKDQPAAD